MANAIAALRILLGLDAAEYTRGLKKAEADTQRFVASTRSAILEVGKVLGSLEIGRQVLESTKAIIAEASALNDLSDATGSSVESLSKLNNQAKIAGTDFATLQTALLKLSQGMAGADEESNKTKEALRILGITTKDPVQALQEAAIKLNGYADGVNKVGLAVALFGKQGGAFVATLKDMAELQDVNATITKQQAAAAEDLEKAYRRLSVEAEGFKNTILSSLVPALRDMIYQLTEGTRIAGGFLQAMSLFGQIRVGGISEIESQIQGVQRALADAEAKAKRNKDWFGLDTGAEAAANFRKQLEYLYSLRARAQSQNPALQAVEDRGFTPAKPGAPNPPGGSEGKARAIRETQSAADSYIKSLEKQLQASLDLNIVETAEVQIYDLMQNAMSGMTAERAAYIRDIAQQLQYTKDAEAASKALAKAQKEEAEEVQRRVDASRRANEQAQHEIDSIKGSVEAVNLQILALTKGEKAVDEYNAAKREQLAVEKEIAAQRAADDGDFALAAKYREAAAALRELNAVSGKLRLAEDLKREAQALQDVKNAISDTFANAFADVITGSKSAKDAFKSLCDDIVRQVSRVAAQNLANALFGGTNQGGPDFFGVLAKLLGGTLGGGAGGGLSGSPIPGSGLQPFAAGGVSSGGFALVGERGPELVNLPSGARVYNNADTQGMLGKSVTIHQTVNVMPGANTQSARQAAARLRDVTLDAVRDR